MIKKLATVLFLVFLATSCKNKPVEEVKIPEKPASGHTPPVYRPMFTSGNQDDAAKNLIVRYNELLVFGYENLNMNPIAEVATEGQAEKAYFHMSAIGEGGVRMLSRVNTISFRQINYPSPEKVKVSTDEDWNFAYTDIKTGRKTEEQKNFIYHVNYSIEKQKDGRWLITDISATSDEPEKPMKKPRSIHGDKFDMKK